ncbi:2-phospho-L-lactate guanylyltransferase [Nocardia farcinica]|uniref:Phosphoenolpyruvate guanylyltransferase n=4 Tax=Nocardia farcinica TaxID=37329 RepID=FBID_NOCFA|nr:2-phospho-L-lactate guanylyltransferase [Nocardia farcinica]Q5YRY5.1 RecName: Full=Phosphoenolpyruvate guanylyltransferase; Short=PEP guanylyltransferase [Nocardia farcinica IFM 10152]AXK88371.1 2-phospho-L-lactate guanylyltransferase [Nocardia farcinica]MBF6071490.1 2-phospho-L-lactate guanylyltransferase [Nocardia farcinica]MBF6141864.1 2-phospho-L-lactate guanylyltransferase [Nocardia farcinica]MBF6230263.1 2-phospho-L-lactate guanylyltransferase [Nocardia farcinica]MBF6257070.1 2-phosp
MRPHAVHALIAVKRLDQAKSRLADRLRPEHRARLVLAMLADTMTATTSVPGIAAVTVVTPDAAVADLARSLGGHVHPEPAADSADSLNAALAAAAAGVRARHGGVDLLALQADLPALRPDELADVLATAPRGGRAIVTDHAGTGTAALLVRDGGELAPAFGPDSARRHIAAGAVDLPGEWPGLRRDVDTAADLERAVELGAGSSTRALLRDIGWSCRVHEPARRVC